MTVAFDNRSLLYKLVTHSNRYSIFKHRDEDDTNDDLEEKVEQAVNEMSNVELLDAIGDALDTRIAEVFAVLTKDPR